MSATTETTRWYRGDDLGTGGRWYAADVEYARFFGDNVVSIEVAEDDILDLTEYGVSPIEFDDWTEGDYEPVEMPAGLPEYTEVEMYAYVERTDVQEAARSAGYRGIRVMQWHDGYSAEAQDTLYLL